MQISLQRAAAFTVTLLFFYSVLAPYNYGILSMTGTTSSEYPSCYCFSPALY
ncbi:hypothetical protein AB691_1055 [Stutzerimonas stutzeri]|nr:hypothetical protein AB691_1055 [Stutzerimonas stutzeri]